MMFAKLKNQFTSLTWAQAAMVNNVAFITLQNAKLQITTNPTEAVWLSDDQVVALAQFDNPEGQHQETHWLSGPMPFNMFQSFFQDSLSNVGRIYICVVNSESQLSMQPSGYHWFTVAWQVTA